MGDDHPALRVGVVDARGRAVRAPGLARWLASIAPRRAHGTVTVALVSDARIRALNRQFRGKDEATDVLSFPSAPGARLPASGLAGAAHLAPRTSHPAPHPAHPAHRAHRAHPVDRASGVRSIHLGDIVIARGVATRQARGAGHALAMELRVLALHGLLHLLGYDHETDEGAMRRVEARLRRRGGLAGGLIEREAAP